MLLFFLYDHFLEKQKTNNYKKYDLEFSCFFAPPILSRLYHRYKININAHFICRRVSRGSLHILFQYLTIRKYG